MKRSHGLLSLVGHPTRWEAHLCRAGLLIVLALAGGRAEAQACRWDSDCPDDGVDCTWERCQNNQCVSVPYNSACAQDGLWCNGDEVCHPTLGCVSSGSPCIPGYVCVESTDQCFQCDSNDDCNDGNSCTDNRCSSSAGGWCYYPARSCNDNNACTSDSCNPWTPGGCVNTPITCNDGNACTTDSCNPATGCVHTPVSCNDGNACTTDSCNPATGACTHSPVACNDGNACTADSCNPATGCAHAPIACNDGLFCNGVETCNPASGCLAGTNACAGQLCDETTDTCFQCGPGGPPVQKGVWFDGSNDSVRVGSPPALELRDAFTVEAWILPTHNSYGIIVNKESEFEIARFPDGLIYWAVNNNVPGWRWISTGVAAPLNRWTHVAWTFDYASTQKINTYLNGVLVHSVNGVGPVRDTAAPADEFRIGGRLAVSNPFGGVIDEVRVWSVARSAAQIQQSMNAVLSGAEPGLKGYWRFEEGSGATTADRASGNPGRLVGASWTTVGCDDGAFCNGTETCGANRACVPAAPNCGGVLCDEAQDRCFNCAAGGPPTRNGLRFDGVDDVVSAGSPAALQFSTALSVEAWILPTADPVPGTGGIIAGKDEEFLLARNPNGTLKWALNTSSPGWLFVDAPAAAPDGRWSHVALTYDGASVRTYLNGALAATQAASGAIRDAAAPVDAFRIGARHRPTATTTFFAGAIDEVRVWSAALDGAAIAAHAAGAGPDPRFQSSLRGWWRFDEGAGTTTADAASGNTASLSGAQWAVVGCADGVPCTVDACAAGQCTHTPNNAACDDGDFCSGAEFCDVALGCRSGPPPACDDGIGCTADSCDPALNGCRHTPENVRCDDGLYCNGAETCSAAAGCRPGAPVACADESSCTLDSCDEGSDACVHDPRDCPLGSRELPITSSVQVLAAPSGGQAFKVDPGSTRVWLDVRQPAAEHECAVTTPRGALDMSQVQYLADDADMRGQDPLGGFMEAMTWTAPAVGTHTLSSSQPFLATVIVEGGCQLLFWIDPLRPNRTAAPDSPVGLHAAIVDGSGQPVDGVSVTGTLTQRGSPDGTPIATPAPLSLTLSPTGEPGRYSWESTGLAAGVWDLKLEAENPALRRHLATSFAVTALPAPARPLASNVPPVFETTIEDPDNDDPGGGGGSGGGCIPAPVGTVLIGVSRHPVDLNKPVVVYVHGASSSYCRWVGPNRFFTPTLEAGYRPAFLNLHPDESVDLNGPLVAEGLRLITEFYDVRKVVIVTHSKGSVDTDWALVLGGAKQYATSVLNLGPPHHGSPLADLAELLMGDLPEWLQVAFGDRYNNATISMKPGNMELLRAQIDSHPNNSGLDIRTIGGWGFDEGDPILPGFGYYLGGLYLKQHGGGNGNGGNDGVVNYKDTRRPGALEIFSGHADHRTKVNHGQFLYRSRYWHHVQAQLLTMGFDNTPSAPGALAAAFYDAPDGRGIALSWQDRSASEAGFRLERAVDGGPWTQLEVSLPSNTQSFLDTTVSAGHSYAYRLRSFVSDQWVSEYSNTATATYPAPTPAAPSQLAAIALSPRSVLLNWRDNSDNETAFEVFRRTSSSEPFALTATVGANVTTLTESGLTPATTYQYQVRAVNLNTPSAFSATAQVATPPEALPAPSELTASFNTTTRRIELRWRDNSTNEDGFHVQFTYSGSEWGDVYPATVGPNVTTWQSGAGPPTGGPYRFRVWAFRGSERSGWSNEPELIVWP